MADDEGHTLRIGELASRTGKSVHTLRYYEREGLVPNVVRDPGGRRLYTERHVMWIELLTRLRRTGMPIRDVRRYADLVRGGDETLAARQEFLRAHRESVEEQIADLRACIELIDVKIDLYQEWRDVGGSPVEVPPAAGRQGTT